MEIKVKGMMCSGCERRCENALKEIGIKNPKADHNKGAVSFEDIDISLDKIKEAIEDIGFEVE